MNSHVSPKPRHTLNRDAFVKRHIGPDDVDIADMLRTLSIDSIAKLIDKTLPDTIRLSRELNLPECLSEQDALAALQAFASKNRVHKSYIGTGYYNCFVPQVIQRNVLENPGWYTAYTPYQPEISQGRLEALLNFQQMVMDLTGMDLANASLLDEATAAAEAMSLCRRTNRKKSDIFLLDENLHPQTIDVVKTRAAYFGFMIYVGALPDLLAEHDAFGVMTQYPDTRGEITDLGAIVNAAKQQDAMVAVGADLLTLVLLKPPGELGADVVFGSAQRFGVPMGFGGPHAAFFATHDRHKRATPGRIIGQSIDSKGKPALRMAMQTREQHIRREKATSNICTAQALLANMASFYAVYHGPQGLREIAERTHQLTNRLASGLTEAGLAPVNTCWFDTLTIDVGDQQSAILERCYGAGVNLRTMPAGRLGISLDETTTLADVKALVQLITGNPALAATIDAISTVECAVTGLSTHQRRTSPILTHPTFNRYHSETEMLRYLKRLENKDFSLTHGMIPLGSCTMKLNATTQMVPVTWAEFGNIHPFAPRDQVEGYSDLIDELEQMLIEITGYDSISMQPNSGAQGEYAGLLAIRKYQESIGEGHRDICLIPSSAHGTNSASAVMAGMKVVVVECDNDGNIDLDDLRLKVEQHSDSLSCIMITYPSTHGVYEEAVMAVCDLVHQRGGQVYMDGANMNAQVGLCKPALIGSDVSHLNLHKTFAIPHGGGGPGMGPIGVKSHLAPFLPNHVLRPIDHAYAGTDGALGVSAAPFGSASILSISWAYCTMLGAEGLKRASEIAILSANYIAEKLAPHYPILYRGRNERVAHECIIDIRPLKETSGISEEDIAKRLMDYGFHAPTMSFPVAGTLMIEPTESESKTELDRFIAAMVGIREEIRRVENGDWPIDDNPLVNAPHTQADLVEVDWPHCYSRQQAVFPNPAQADSKFWPAISRIDNVYGDRNFVCSCPPIDAYRDPA